MRKAILLGLFIFSGSILYAEPVERHGISLSSGWSGWPSFVKTLLNKESGNYYNLQGFTSGISYIYYGKGGPKGIFSGRYSFSFSRYNALPQRSDFIVDYADVYVFDIAGIWTILPSLPVNLYIGLGTGFGVFKLYNWDVNNPLADAEKIQKAKDSYGKYPLPLPIPIYIPFGLNLRIKNFIINVEAGLKFPVTYLVGGLTFAFGKSEDVKIVKETIQLPPPPPDTGRIRGRIIDIESKQPIGRAIISISNSGMSDLSVADDGTFITPELKTGETELIVFKEGYHKQTVNAKVEQGKTTETIIELKKELQIGAIGGIVQDLQGNPLSATISVVPVEATEKPSEVVQPITVVSDAKNGEYMLKLKPGDYTVTAKLEHYKTATMNTTVKAGFKTRMDFKLEPESPAVIEAPAPPSPPIPVEKKPKVYIEKEKIVITDTIYFGSGKANILPVSFPILDEVARVLMENPKIKIRIEGHTDSMGNDETNMRLSQSRAESVMKYLIRKGISAERMEAKGYGETMPVADNSTPEGRAKNRRVEFVIVEQ